MTSALLPNGIEVEYDTFGSSDDPVLLLVMGLGAQMIVWEEGFCRRLADGGRYVVRFDNRDVGLSTKLSDQIVDPMAVMAAALSGADIPSVPYLLSDMAADAVALLDHLDVGRAHVVGVSMGGMIVQTMAIEHPDRLISVTSVMSTVGDPAYGSATAEAMGALLAPPPTTRDEAIAAAAHWEILGTKRYFDLERNQRIAAAQFDRSPDRAGTARQLAAIIASGDRTPALQSVAVPMLVIHGHDDQLIDISGGRRTAELVPGAQLLEVADMGHDMPEPLWPLLTGAILGHGDVAASTGHRSVTAQVGA